MSNLKTRFPGLSYKKEAPGQWTFIDDSTNGAVGPKYPTQIEILADAQRFAEERGYTDTRTETRHKVQLVYNPAAGSIIPGRWEMLITTPDDKHGIYIPITDQQRELLREAIVVTSTPGPDDTNNF